MAEPLLSVENLTVAFGGGQVAVDGVSFELLPGETLGIVGESGSGKSLAALSVLGLAPGRVSGRVRYGGRDLLTLSDSALNQIRGAEIAMIFQEPMTALNPVFTVGRQIAETLRVHRGLDAAAARARCVGLLRQVGIADPEARLDRYPHELSGGMRQRVMIAIALACGPKLLIADEPTTALDVTIQAQILALLRELQAGIGMALVLITHDLGVVAQMVDRLLVMYAGRIVEEGPVEAVFDEPAHPYTRLLLESIPSLDQERERLAVIPGAVPPLGEMPAGCRFHPRCPQAGDDCRAAVPAPRRVAAGHTAACFRVVPAMQAAR
jgi:oligopeptide/dipeptide ABC transporter ATP-binding protein